MTYRALCARLEEAGVDSPAYDAARLIAHFCGVDERAVPLEPMRVYDSPALSSFSSSITSSTASAAAHARWLPPNVVPSSPYTASNLGLMSAAQEW